MKRSLFCLLTVIVGCLFGSLAMAEDGERITLNGPYFSIKEPWVSNDFKKESVKHKEMQLPDFTVDIDDPNRGISDPAKVFTKQKKTVKTADGKAYLLQVTKSESLSDDEGFVAIGLRHIIDDENMVVTFYKIKHWDSSYYIFHESYSDGEEDSDYNLNAIYAGTLDGRPIKLIEFNDMFWSRDRCKEYDENDSETGSRDEDCLKTSVKLDMSRCVFVVDEVSEAVVGNVVLKRLEKSYSSVEEAKKAANKVKKLADVKEFKLSDAVTCRKYKAEKLSRFECLSTNNKEK